METNMTKKYLFLAILVLVICDLMNPSRATSMKTNRSRSIIGDDDDLEFLMDSHSSRILRSGDHVTDGTRNRDKPARDCGRGVPYKACTPEPNSSTKPSENCGVYNRVCGR
ncbi:hypothetical protein HRI_000575700 [Hibiscus trionum]|uniref:Rapid ALkalinization Factor n=1 Tax=Hibiscus trionum TaxID=183268 RepID=A0A9W7LLS2_HIBTR|nr:hypothetical protein HRI_000575700 [Hibiscus trionum]